MSKFSDRPAIARAPMIVHVRRRPSTPRDLP
jgi:hypothetical protein